MTEIGLQLFSVREKTEKDLVGTIRKLASYGYDSLQFAGFFETPAEELRAVLEEEKVKVAGVHTGLHQLQGSELEQTLQFNETIGNDLLICPVLPKQMRGTGDDYKQTAERLNEVGEECRKAGFTFGYHNHNWEFEQYGGKTGFDLLFENTDPELVKMELDCYWASYAGHDPAEIMEKYKNRCISLHLKDMKMESGNKTSTEIGTGILDLNQFIETGKRNGVGWFIIEQEDYDRNPMDVAKDNLENLKKQLK
ncbi:sugar phosphate isomerase/epimerase family protein [Sediminibacillus massiliensis]|uniref:sugar phosphate isomerase/epimerase family protein n=1 Tax=Sediminibacillus massiliensis TaxID=1926277 RepID=UPI0009885ACC|nr:sugar phosphate isomerase/epimerase family protein [Sediminibacillus massiliensis]